MAGDSVFENFDKTEQGFRVATVVAHSENT